MKTKEDILELVEEEEIEFIRLQFTDMFGNLRGTYKLIPYKKYIALEINVMVRLPKDTEDVPSEELANVML